MMKLVLAASVLASTAAAQGQEVALTFDDLPRHAKLPPGLTRAQVIESILKSLRAGDAPRVYGFVNGRKLEDEPSEIEVLRLWLAAGYPLGNHSYSHMDLHANDARAFEEDVVANERLLSSLMPQGGWKWFRYPYLREGDELEKRRAVRKMLLERGYRIAQTTLDFEDFLWNDPYARCVAKSDLQAIEWLKESYMDTAAEYIRLGQEMSRMIYGRDIKHVMLLHVGGFQTVMLPNLLDRLERGGFQLITLEDAESDPAYENDPDLPSRWGGTLLEQILEAKKLEMPAHKQKPYQELERLCR